MILLLSYSAISLVRLKKQLRTALPETDLVYISDRLTSPFVMGLIKPNIYLPPGLSCHEKNYILSHEQMHIKHFDHIIKLVSFLTLCIHWFNPLVWAAFFLSGMDMEMSCDESVIRQLGSDAKKDYSASLLRLATGKRIINGSPLAFGEGDTRSRIHNILNCRKPAIWAMIAAAAAVVILCAVLIANPTSKVPFLKVDRSFGTMPLHEASAVEIQLPEGVVILSEQKEIDAALEFIKQLQVNRKEVNQNRSQDREQTYRIIFHQTKSGNNSYQTVNISGDYSRIWTDNGVKPSLSYPVLDPNAVKTFIGAQKSALSAPIEVTYTVSSLSKGKTTGTLDTLTEEQNDFISSILMSAALKSTLYDGKDPDTLAEGYLIRQTFKDRDGGGSYYAYGRDGEAFLQRGCDGACSLIDAILYQ